MTQSWLDNAKFSTASTSASGSCPVFLQSSSNSCSRNVFKLLESREISPRGRHSKKLWGLPSKNRVDCTTPRCEITDARHALVSWVEAESLRHLSARYCPLLPPPRSTIAAAFSSDGKTLASTHGDHTVKIIDCQTGNCLKVLSGHRRTPWVVRFHPLRPEIIASGSLDHEVRLWNAHTGDCIGSRDFYRPIASIAFHAQGEILAVASGHKLFIWHYNRVGDPSSPTIVLKTRRSLRAVHFHPHAAPFLLTAEVNDLDSPDSPLTLATSAGYVQYPPPAVFFASANSSLRPYVEAKLPLMLSPYLFWPTVIKEDERTSFQDVNRATTSVNNQQRVESTRPSYPNTERQNDSVAPMETCPAEVPCLQNVAEGANNNSLSDSIMENAENNDSLPPSGLQNSSSAVPPSTYQLNGMTIQMPTSQSRSLPDGSPVVNGSHPLGNIDLQMLSRSVEAGHVHPFISFSDPACWELPFLQGWLMGQSHAGLHTMGPVNTTAQGNLPVVRGPSSNSTDLLHSRNLEALLASSAIPTNYGHTRGSGRSASRHRPRSRLIPPTGSGEGASFPHPQNDVVDSHHAPSNIESDISSSLAAAAAAELPCTVKLRIWTHDIQNPCAPLDNEICRLTIPHAVLCSEMGAHFSPCGRFLAACVACMLPRLEGDPGLHSQMHYDSAGAATSPTRHPISAHQVMYELRIYSLEEATFGSILASRAIRAAHCLTSIQFSPTSEHILLAYGRRHNSLLRSIVVDGETAIPIYTVLEVYRVSDMELVRVLPSAEDEVNVACFHPLVGGGLVYGTKEGKLRILQYDGSNGANCNGSNFFLEENMLEVQKYALEC
ncbi:activating molecule in BECN1-regulated autophagy protein 1 [Dioscorea alata]|uniref:Activating molecule in BECN1-regulated autophagy protein 1 n=1 Tax=Dioscorea alata TaxID=55571 RepID=A0ACB7WRN1_DIOAL|nr:activating molecule in BECN1-regulated autophagy protein 1 [Dioscorea alata]